MKKIVLLGDSIRLLGYGRKISEYLGDEYSVWQSEDNSRYSYYTLRFLYDFKDKIEGADVIHWNNGIWDAFDVFENGEPFIDIDTYIKTMKRIAVVLKQYSNTVIFATTTPVRDSHKQITNERINEYNSRIVPVLSDMGIIINDLNAFVKSNISSFIREDDNVHLTELGSEKCAEQVAKAIKNIS